MSSSLVVTGGVPALVMPPMSFELARAIEQIIDPHPDLGIPDEWPVKIRGEARLVGAALRHVVAPVTPQRLYEWTMPVLLSAMVTVGKERSQRDIDTWLASLGQCVAGLAIGAFTVETQQIALRTIRFVPFPADIYDVVAPHSRRILERFDALKRILRSAIQ